MKKHDPRPLFVIAACLLLSACLGQSDSRETLSAPTPTLPDTVAVTPVPGFADSSEATDVVEIPVSSTPSTAVNNDVVTVPPVNVEEILLDVYPWGFSPAFKDAVANLQAALGVPVDGHYGPQTRAAHIAMIQSLSLSTENVPSPPEFGTPTTTIPVASTTVPVTSTTVPVASTTVPAVTTTVPVEADHDHDGDHTHDHGAYTGSSDTTMEEMYLRLGVDVSEKAATARAGGWFIDHERIFVWPCRTITWTIKFESSVINPPAHLDPVLATEIGLAEIALYGGPAFSYVEDNADLTITFLSSPSYKQRNPTLADALGASKSIETPNSDEFAPYLDVADYFGPEPWTVTKKAIDINAETVYLDGAKRYSQESLTNLMIHESIHTLGIHHNTSKESLMYPTMNHNAHHADIPAGDLAAVQLFSGDLCAAIGKPYDYSDVVAGPAPTGFVDAWVDETITDAVNRGSLTEREKLVLQRSYVWMEQSDDVSELGKFLETPYDTSDVYDSANYINHVRALRYFNIQGAPFVHPNGSTVFDGHLRVKGKERFYEHVAGNAYDSMIQTAVDGGWDLDRNLLTVLPCRTLNYSIEDKRTGVTNDTRSASEIVAGALDYINSYGGPTFEAVSSASNADVNFILHDDGTKSSSVGSGQSQFNNTLRWDSTYVGPTVRVMTGTSTVNVDASSGQPTANAAWTFLKLMGAGANLSYDKGLPNAFNEADRAVISLHSSALCTAWDNYTESN